MTPFEKNLWDVVERDLAAASPRPFRFTTGVPEHGWIDAAIEVQGARVEISISDVYPPFVEMVGWLERLIASPECSEEFAIYDELREHRFRVTRAGNPALCDLEYVTTDSPGGIYLRACIGFVELVREFHGALRSLLATNTYEEWDRDDGFRNYFNLDAKSDDFVPLDLSRLDAFLRDHAAL